MKRVCAWCGEDMGDGGPGEGTTHGICERCLEDAENNLISLGRGFTSGRCVACNVRYVWSDPIMLRRACCPHCGRPLKATTHLFRGRTEPLVRPAVQGPGRLPAGVRT